MTEPLPDLTPEPTLDEIAALLQVEHLLDQRWPETKLEPSTTRIVALLELLGSPQRAYPSIHVAGTNGKTSVARIIDALLTALHRRTGRTTSPHLQSAVERISIDGKPITPAVYVDTYRELEPFIELVDRQSESAGGPRLSKFEVVTAMAFAAFADAPIDVAVVEVGMGGRWDATNVVDAPVAVITPIGVDHTEYLGDTIPEIAAEKAGIIVKRDGAGPGTDTVVIIGRQVPEAMEVVLAEAVRADAAVAREGSSSRCSAARWPSAGSCSNYRASAASTPRSSCRCTVSTRRTTPCSRSPRWRRSSARVHSGSSTSTRCARVSLRR